MGLLSLGIAHRQGQPAVKSIDLTILPRAVDGDGIEILGGFGPLAGKVFRIGIMGAGSREENVLLLLDRMEAAFRAEGFTPKSSGVEAARAFYAA